MIPLTYLMLLAAPCEHPNAPGSLWQRAVSLWGVGKTKPRTMTERERVYDSSGELVELTVSRYKIDDSPGGLSLRLVSSTKNGADNMAAKRQEFEQEPGADTLLDVDDLFHPAAQERVEVKSRREAASTERPPVVVFEFFHRTSTGDAVGEAYIDAKSGRPIRTITRPAKLPIKHGDLKISALESTVNYATSPSGEVRIDRVRVVTEFVLDGPLFFDFEGRAETELTFSE